MATKYLDSNGLLYLWQKIRTTFTSGLTWDKTNKKIKTKKKTGTSGAEEATDLLQFSAGSNVTLTGGDGTLTIAATDTTYSAATTSAAGLMSSTDKTKLDGIATGAEVNVQADWNQTTTTADDYIKNKPTIPSAVSPSTDTPWMDMVEGDAGSSALFARGDHVHPQRLEFEEFEELDTTGYLFSIQDNYTNDHGYFYDNDAVDALLEEVDNIFLVTYGTTTYAEITAALATGKVLILYVPTTGNYAFYAGDGGGNSYNFGGYLGISDTYVYDYYSVNTNNLWTTDTIGMASANHAHGNIYSGGTLQTSDVTISSGDKLVITDSSNSNKVARASTSFDGSSTDKVLTPKGTFETLMYDDIGNTPTLGTAAAKDTVLTITSNSNDVPTVTAVKSYVSNAITGAAAFQGTAPTTFAPTNYKKGWYWVVGTAGTYAGQTCEAGDMIFAIADYSSSYSASDFDVIQTNLDITAITNAEIDTIVAA